MCQDPRGADQLGNAPGVITLALKHIQHPQSDYRELWLKVIRRGDGISVCTALQRRPGSHLTTRPTARRCLLLNPAGRKQCVYREGVLQDLSAAAAALDGQQSEASYRKQLVRVWAATTQHFPARVLFPGVVPPATWESQAVSSRAVQIWAASADGKNTWHLPLPAARRGVAQQVSVAAEIRLYMTREQAQNGGGSAAAGD